MKVAIARYIEDPQVYIQLTKSTSILVNTVVSGVR